MGLIEEEFSKPLLSGMGKAKANKTRNIRVGLPRENATRVSRGSPEVLVKISGFTKGATHLKAHMTYISRNGKIDLEDQNGATYEGLAEVSSLCSEWGQTISQANTPRINRRDTVKLVLSMPPGTDPDALQRAARSFAMTQFENHAYLFAVHTDEAHPHAHLTVHMQGMDGARLNPRKADLHRWRERFAHCLLNEGVDCVATPRSARNQKRGQRQARRHADERRQLRGQGEFHQEIPEKSVFLERSKVEWAVIRERCRKIVQASWLAAVSEFESGKERFDMPKPNYKRYEKNDEGRKNWRLDAALYQPGTRDVGGIRETKPYAGLRNLPRSEVVRLGKPLEGLLQGTACHRLGRLPEAHHYLRRERNLVGPDGAGGVVVATETNIERSLDVQASKMETVRSVRRFAQQLGTPSIKPEGELDR